MQVIGFPEYQTQSRALAEALECDWQMVEIHRFPDGESRVRLPQSLEDHLVLCRSLDRPHDKLIELLLCAKAARQRGVQRITLVAPYLCYLRQDAAFHPGEVVSNRIIGGFLAELVDAVITVDPHLHRVQHLAEVIPIKQAITLSATGLLADFLADHSNRPLLLGPDRESRQWVQAIAEQRALDYGVASKQRLDDHRVAITLPDLSFANRHVILVDDVISTGHTLLQAVAQLQAAKAASIACLVTHALFAEDAYTELQAAGVSKIWSTDSISHQTNVISLAPLLVQAVQEIQQ